MIIQLKSVGKSYRSGARDIEVLRNVSLSLEAGQICSLIGPSGSGKTSLLGICAGLDRPTTGDIRLCGHVLNELSEDGLADMRNRHVGFVFQTFQLIPTLTALENVLVPAELRGSSSSTADAKALLERVGLSDRGHHYPAQLSGGEQQRVALARAFINKPQILFADEPTGNLDSSTADTVEDLLFELNREAGTTLVIATHNLALAERTQRRLRLEQGQIVEGT